MSERQTHDVACERAQQMANRNYRTRRSAYVYQGGDGLYIVSECEPLEPLGDVEEFRAKGKRGE